MQAQSADGVIHDFPDGTDISVVDRVMKDYAGEQKQDAPATFTEYGPDATTPATGVQSQAGADINAVGQGAVSGTGAVIAGAGRIAQAGQGPSAQRVLAALDLIDQGKTRDAYQGLSDPERQEIGAYRGGTGDDKAAQRAELQQSIVDYSKPNAAMRAGSAIEGAAPGMFPVAPEHEGIQTGVGRMIGGVAPAMAATAALGPLGAAATIASQTYDGTYQDAIAKGATHEEADNAAGKSAVAQTLTMALPVSRLLTVPVSLREGLAKTLVNLGQNGVEFGSANAIGTFANNYVASQTYDPTRSLTQGVGQAGLEGAIAGLIIPAVGGIARAGATVGDVLKAPDVDTAIAAAKVASHLSPSFNSVRGEVEPEFTGLPQESASTPGAFDWADLFAKRPAEPASAEDATTPAGVPTPLPETPLGPAAHGAADDIPLIQRASAAAKEVANNWYQKADETGGTLAPDFTNALLDKAEDFAKQTRGGKLTVGESPISGLLDRWQELRDQPISLQEANEMDQGLGDLIDKEFNSGRLSGEGRNLLDLQTTFRNMIRDAGPEDTGGGTEGFDALKQGRAAWAQAMKITDLERILDRAQLTDNPATSIKSGIRVLLSNPARVRGYDGEEIAALKSAADRGSIGAVLHVFGSRLIPYAAGAAGLTGGPLGAGLAAGAGYVGSTAARNAATALQTRRMNNAISVLSEGVPEPPQ